MESYAVGFARPDRWSQSSQGSARTPWHAVPALRPLRELDGEVELALCGAITQIWGGQQWSRVGAGRTGCAECRRLSGLAFEVAQLSRAG
ncbi:hypothetical protein ACWKWC_13375 [Geodermatophilus nigrescens]|uniref:hypothetical protein n=1 Tax=Geodermatophilus sp. FMUSA9-8 TaxID=3120155 RepID=UPI003008B17C